MKTMTTTRIAKAALAQSINLNPRAAVSVTARVLSTSASHAAIRTRNRHHRIRNSIDKIAHLSLAVSVVEEGEERQHHRLPVVVLRHCKIEDGFNMWAVIIV